MSPIFYLVAPLPNKVRSQLPGTTLVNRERVFTLSCFATSATRGFRNRVRALPGVFAGPGCFARGTPEITTIEVSLS